MHLIPTVLYTHECFIYMCTCISYAPDPYCFTLQVKSCGKNMFALSSIFSFNIQ